MRSYDHQKIEKKWQKEWEKNGLYRTSEDSREKMYVLDMFPYPSGDGLHVGHPKGYIATDIVSRHARMQGKSVLHPMGWDAFGLPAENYAIKNKVHPRKAVEKNVARFKEQLKLIGLDYDWGREINTTDPEFYKWTQWIFLKLYEKGLAYESNEPINWCPTCQTGLSNEDLEGNACERCGTMVEKRPMRQWILKITDYAERMLKDLDLLPEWQAHIKESQRNWIGKSEGAEISFELTFEDTKLNENRGPHGEKAAITVFTTRPDTLFGATFLILSPEHQWVQLAIRDDHAGVLKNQDDVRKYVVKAAQKTEIERQENKEKTGVKLEGVEAINPATGEKIPLYVADYVLANYGTGAIMAVPAHDDRDFDFAKKFNLPIKAVMAPYTVVQGTDAPRSDENIVCFNAATAIVKHWNDDLYYAVVFKNGQYGLPGGHVENYETSKQAALREIIEETGYSDIKSLDLLFEKAQSRGYKTRKSREELCTEGVYVAQLASGKQAAIDDIEAEKGYWMTGQELLAHKDLIGSHRVFLEHYLAGKVFTGNGVVTNSGEFNGLATEEAKEKITEKFGIKKTTYKIRDWVFSRQRYWGEPIPIVHCEKDGSVAVPYDQLPVKLPEVEHYEPTGTGESPLAAISEWVNTTCPKCGERAKRETNTMPQWAGSSWYYLRYMDPHNDTALVGKKEEQYWAPVDLYVGGAEHATRHLIYARFWHKFLFDEGYVSTPEPFTRLISVGLIQAEDGRKMSKRYGNVINPDDIVETYGADTLRVYEMFMGPFTDAIAWKTASLIGARRFLERVWRLNQPEAWSQQPVAETERTLHQTIKKVGEDIANFKFNTAISQMMIFVNAAEEKGITKAQYQTFITLLAPFAPHITEDIWHELGNSESIHVAPWPQFDSAKLMADSVTMVVQINGKVRAQIQMPTDSSEADVRQEAEKASAKWLEGQSVKKVIFVANKLINFVLD